MISQITLDTGIVIAILVALRLRWVMKVVRRFSRPLPPKDNRPPR
ncbi:MAG TPA: hypothetical protein VK679_03165 [Gemmatimonadaceae bacterium]|jgi:hypothetical protein|nr:hypothetical protein [Gemmatimonadaceae bacterium]